jgi:ATP-dependent Zn protease
MEATKIDEGITRVIAKAHERVPSILTEQRKVLDDLAHLLAEKETVLGDELRQIPAEYKSGKTTVTGLR